MRAKNHTLIKVRVLYTELDYSSVRYYAIVAGRTQEEVLEKIRKHCIEQGIEWDLEKVLQGKFTILDDCCFPAEEECAWYAAEERLV